MILTKKNKSDRMPVADAVADAETLRAFAITHPSPITVAVTNAGARGALAVALLAEGAGIVVVATAARQGASRAFRAVPGLRGE
jgi:hypothetical protein